MSAEAVPATGPVDGRTARRDRNRDAVLDAVIELFTEGEVAYCTRRRVPAIHLAARFASKEAAMKALGTGHSLGVFWRGIEVVRRSGPPRIRFHHGAADRFASIGATGSFLTMTHSRDMAIAHVLLVRGPA